ncbi:tetratricopeptide repeat protein [Microcoleus sp. AT9_A2]|uniref:tetratricopeptide repeat protein n=1 Tax=Microcoleus sp. AT9_A2 TaxID=2818624 RepID=UPI002FD56DFF
MEPKKTAVDYLDEGDQLVEEGNLEGAIAAFRRAIELNPDLSWSHHNLGEALAKLGQFEEAIAAFRRSIKLKPDFSWSYHHLGDALDRQQQWEEAVAAFRKAIELDADHFGSYCGLGQSLVKLGQLDEAIAAYRRASELEPEADWIQYKLREVLEQRTQLELESAIASDRRTLEIAPENLEVWQHLRETLVRVEQWEEAIAACRSICQLNSESVEAYHELASCLSRFTQQKLDVFRSNPNGGKIAINQLQSQKPGIDLHLLNDRAFSQATCHLNDRDFVQEVYRAYLKREPEASAKEAWSKCIREGTLTRQGLIGDVRQSDEFKNLVISYGDREAEIARHWQVIKISYEYLDEEIACYQQAIEISPNCDRSYYQLGQALTKGGKSAEAIYFYRKAFELNPNNLEAERKLPRIYDCFPFFNEIDILKIRIEELKDVVDKFVLVEATKTHSGRPKPLYYQEFSHEFAEYQDKIIHHIVDDMPEVENNNRWPLENYQRDCIGRVLAAIKCNDEDIILVSDVDEIPRKEKISEAVELLSKNEYVIFCHDMYRYDLEQFESEWWCGTVACKYKEVKVRTATQVRRSDLGMWDFPRAKAAMFKQARMLEYPDIEKGGWHFTSMGNTASSYWYKVQSFAHPEVDLTEKLGIEYVNFEVGRTGLDDEGSGEYYYDCNLSEIAAKDLPIFLKNNAYKYRHLFPKKPTKLMQIHGDIEQAESRVKELQVEIGQAESNLKEIAGKYRQLGEALAKHGDWEGAIMAYRSFIELKPEVAEVYGQLGDALAQQGNRDEAIAAYSRALALAPEAEEIYSKLEAVQQQKKWDLEAAMASYRRAIELNPDDVQAYRKLLEIQPENSEIWLKLGKALVKQNEWEEALTWYVRACEVNPESFDCYYQLGKTLYRWRQIELELLQSNPDAGKVILKEIWDNSTLDLYQVNDEAFLRATHYLDDSNFVQEVYRTYLKREPEAGAKESYPRAIGDGELSRKMFISNVRHSGEFQLLLAKYGQREEEIACHWRSIEIQQEHLEKEIACYQRMVELNPYSYESYYRLGEALTRKGNSASALAAYQKAVQIGRSLVQEKEIESALSCYQQALEIIPEQVATYLDLGLLLVREGLLYDVLQCYQQAFKAVPNSCCRAYHNLAIALAQQSLTDEALICFQQAPQIPASIDWKIYENIWMKLNSLKHWDEEEFDYEVEIQQQSVEEYFSQASRYKVITLQPILSEDDRKYLEKVGLSLANLELMKQNNWMLEGIYINSFSDSSTEIPTQKINLTFSYQQSLLETGYIYAVCPMSGKIIRSNQSFVINHLEGLAKQMGHDLQGFFYRFVGSEIFYLMVGLPLGEKLFLYYPKLELIINLDSDYVGMARPEASINKLKSYMISSEKKVKSYLEEMEEKKLVDVVGLGFNIGHYLWQDVTGIDVIYQNRTIQKIDKLLIGPGEYFSIRDIFPEIPSDNFIEVQDVANVFQIILDNNYVAFRANGIYIEEQLIKRISEVSINKCSQGFLAQVERAKKSFPLLGLQIRGSRNWVSQVEGIANIIKNLYSEFPNLGVVFDGWSMTGKEDFQSSSWSMIEKEKKVVEEILDLIPPKINTYSAVGSTTYETVVWHLAMDLHISPIGSGLTFPSWIANKPGVVHGHTMMYWTQGMYASSRHRENLIPQVFLPQEVIIDGEGRSYDCDWKVIYEEAIKIVKQVRNKNNLNKL